MKISVAAQPLFAQAESAHGLQPLLHSAKAEGELREVFQKFVAGTFYGLMFKAMRKMQGRAAYFHGGQAEEMFQSRMDQEVSDSLAKEHGASLAEPLFQVFSAQLRARALTRNQANTAQPPARSVRTAINPSPTQPGQRSGDSTSD
ncbi:MAG: rod-binding protein [Planctomycetes bacterium]|nr:rod-binding protein [Planctomycetota bacterium]